MPIEAFRRNQPLSLSLTQTNTQTLANGTQHGHVSHERLYRDSSGRLRIETFYDNGQPFTITLIDPVAGKILYLKVVAKEAISMNGESSRMMSSLVARTASANIKPKWPGETTETLPSKTIDGFTADGTRRAWTIPAGTPGSNNDRPVNVVSVEWFCPQLGIDLQQSIDDPRAGEITMTASDIKLQEPDPSLFQLPSDYKLTTQ